SKFSINNETAPFYVNPGFVVATEDFSLKLQNLLNKKIEVNIATGEITESNDSGGFFSSFSKDEEIVTEQETVELKSGEIKNVKFAISGLEEDILTEITLSSEGQVYKVPVFVFATEGNSIDRNKDKEFR